MSLQEPWHTGQDEPWWQTLIAAAVALLLAGGFLYYVSHLLVPVHGGVDQNGYLVGAKQIALTGTMKQRPTLPGEDALDPHQNVGRMWVGAELGTDRERYYPKYPIGLPALYALGLLAGGAQGVNVVYWFSPVAMTLAAWMTFQLGRRFVGSIGGLMAMLLFVTAPVTLALSTNPNSHATAVCCVVSGMYFLFTFLQRGGSWRALLAGLLCGYAVTIRYTEGALLLPIALAALFAVRSSVDRTRAWRGVMLLTVGWLIPVGGLVIYNLVAMGALTGYDPTNESSGFRLEYAIDNWETMLRQLSTTGLFFVMPLSVAGMAAMYFWNWRWALIVGAWVLPCLAVYTFYYWAPDTSSVGYVRFFLTILPAFCVAAAWTCRTVTVAATARGYRAAALWPVTLILAIAACAQLQQGVGMLETDHAARLALQNNVRQIAEVVEDDAAVFCGDMSILHHLQLTHDGPLYHGETFSAGFTANLLNAIEMDEPQGLDPMRRAALHERLGAMNQPALDEAQRAVVNAWIAAGRRVYYVSALREGSGLPKDSGDAVGQRQWPDILKRWQRARAFEMALRGSWNTPVVRPGADPSIRRARRGDARPDRRQGYWQIVEVTPRPTAATRPAATRPASTTRAASTRPASTRATTTRPSTTQPSAREAGSRK